MFVYWTMFAVPALSTLAMGTRRTGGRGVIAPGVLLILLVFTVMIGLRYQVGTDWFNYKRTIDNLFYTNFAGALASKDAGFGVLVWTANRLGNGIYITNFVCASIMMYGVARFAHRQPDSWMALTASVPYLVIVVGMGYTRQAAAIGFVLLAILALEEKKLFRAASLAFLASTFHGSALCLLPVGALAVVRTNKALILPSILLSIVLLELVLTRRLDNLYRMYITREEAFDSAGAAIRLMMNAIPALLFLMARKRFSEDGTMRFFWTCCAIISLLLLVALPVFPSSTALDRIGLYFIPIQLFVFGHLPQVFGRTPQGARIVSYCVILYYGATLFVWLQYASNAHAWLPYRFAPFM